MSPVPTLLDSLFRARRRDDVPVPPWEGALACDDVVLGESEGTLALQVLESAGVSRVRADRVLVVADRHPLARFEHADTIARFEERAHALGCQFARPGAGRADFIYLERGAMPLRIAVTAGIPPGRVGALGELELCADTLEAATAMARGGFVAGAIEARTLVLEGRPAPGVSGIDLAWAIAPRLDVASSRFAVLSVIGSTVPALSMRDRLQLVGPLGAASGASPLLPSDAATREWFRARGREADWRALDPPEEAAPSDALRVEVESMEPLLVSGVPGGGTRRVLDLVGSPVGAVRIGPDLTIEDAWFVASRLAGRAVHARTRVVIDAGCAAMQEALEACGAWQALLEAGCDVRVAPGALQADEGHTLCHGGPAEGRTSWRASLETCTLSALHGEMMDPRGWEGAEAPPLPAAAVVSSAWLVPAPPADETRPGPPVRRAGSARGPLRGVLLYRGGDDVDVASLLPWGARLEPDAGDVDAFAPHVLESLDPEFAKRARACEGGFVSAGQRFGVGSGAAERAALALRALGVHVLLAESFDPAYRRRLVHAGLLPLRFARAHDRLSFEPGDELELPSALEALEPARPLVVRNLTRGLQIICSHDLDGRELEVVRAGGLLAHARFDHPQQGRQE